MFEDESLQRVLMQGGKEVWSALALRSPLIYMLTCEWDKDGHEALEDSLVKKLIPMV